MTDSNGYADLHLHSSRSDGHCSPTELIDKCLSLGLRALAIVDHDDVTALAEAIEYGKKHGMEVITGVELSVSFRDQDIHILGYCFDFDNRELVDYLAFVKEERIKRAKRIVEKLAQLGMPISFEAVLKKAGVGSVGRPHIADLLVEEGHVYSFQEAFNRYLGDGKPGNVKKHKTGIQKALKLVNNAGGVCSIAHPGLQIGYEKMLELIKAGVDGIEVIHPRHNEQRVQVLRELVKRNGLLETGGSDYHGDNQGNNVLGKYKVRYKCVTRLKEAAATLKGYSLAYDN
ncbi:PHP domain-containing protein [candidate division KSB1 bacterium]|nr:PHP domain-containing protein [candidate division KSB1 bacterium]NIR68810.1 PHP domain-containing protein [candidate division KSB1 bacterium]NIS27173.1 PHP domain-containing protein [candidate division KSB1 bacterium]NIU26923.1 PHP domain-containing protein [candidate division KSB1 bacterium]NIU89728.1 PHP domain-containing protein [candidate division KSB1 bacterium]